MLALLSGISAGMIHVFSGPDHLAAVAPLSLANWKKSVALGFRWGLGHSSGVLFVGMLALLLREVLPLEAISGWAERSVGLLLVGIGLWGLRQAARRNVHMHEHTHDGSTHAHFHVHGEGARNGSHDDRAHARHTHTAFAVGTIHGIAGSSHLFGVLPALVFSTRFESLTYLTSYGAGTIAAMILFSGAIGWFARGLQPRPLHFKVASCATSAFAIVLGVYWVAQ